MIKTKYRMRCAICDRPLERAAALQAGYPVGPVCAAAAGLLPGRGAATSGGGKHAHGTGPSVELFRDTATLDLFQTL